VCLCVCVCVCVCVGVCVCVWGTQIYEDSYLRKYRLYFSMYLFLSGDMAVGDVLKGMYKQCVYH